MKLEEDKINGDNPESKDKSKKLESSMCNLQIMDQTPLSSTTKSLDLPPKEYEV
jgi:hypothetical protein